MPFTMTDLCTPFSFLGLPNTGAAAASRRPAPFPGGSRPAATHTAFAGALAVLSIVAYGLIIAALPAGSAPLLVFDNLGSTLAALVSAGLALLAAQRHTTRRARLSWRLLGLALAAWAFGDGYWSWSEIVLGVTPDVPSLADVGYLSMAALVIAGAATHPIARRHDVSRTRLLLDAAMLLSAMIAVAWSVALGPLFARLQTEPLTQVVTLLYPIGSVSALFLLTMLMVRAFETPVSTRLLAAGLSLIAAADAAYVVLATNDTYTTGHITDWFWFSGAVLLGLAALLDRPQPAPLAAPEHIGHPWRFLAPAGLLVLAGVVVWAGASNAHAGLPSPAEAALAIAAGLLVMRMAVGYRDAVLVHQLHVERAQEQEFARLAREEAARLQGVILTGRELSHLLGNDLAVTVGWIDLLRTHPSMPIELQPLIDDASGGLERATAHVRKLQMVERIATHDTPVGPALDLDQASTPSPE